MKFKKKQPTIIEAITFAEFIEYGKNNGANIVDGMPWSFNYKGHPITQENDKCYIIPTSDGQFYFTPDVYFTPDDMLITDINNKLFLCKIDIFEKIYEAVE